MSRRIDGETMETVTDCILLGSKITADSDCSHEIKRHLLLKRRAMKNQTAYKKGGNHFAYKGLYSQNYGFSSSHVQMWERDHKEGWEPKNWYFQTMVLKKILESPLTSKEIKPVNPKGNKTLNIHEKDWCWSWSSSTLATRCLELARWKRPWCWEKLRARREGYDRGWAGWVTSSIQWTWVWANSGR